MWQVFLSAAEVMLAETCWQPEDLIGLRWVRQDTVAWEQVLSISVPQDSFCALTQDYSDPRRTDCYANQHASLLIDNEGDPFHRMRRLMALIQEQKEVNNLRMCYSEVWLNILSHSFIIQSAGIFLSTCCVLDTSQIKNTCRDCPCFPGPSWLSLENQISFAIALWTPPRFPSSYMYGCVHVCELHE